MGSGKRDCIVVRDLEHECKIGGRKSMRVLGINVSKGWDVKIIVSHINAHKSASAMEEDPSS